MGTEADVGPRGAELFREGFEPLRRRREAALEGRARDELGEGSVGPVYELGRPLLEIIWSRATTAR